MRISATRRDLAVAAVAATVGGSVVAGAFMAASLLRNSQSLSTENGNLPLSSMDITSNDTFLLKWTRYLLRRASMRLGDRTAAVKPMDGMSKNWDSFSSLAEDGFDETKHLSIESSTQTSRSCNSEDCCHKEIAADDIVQRLVTIPGDEQPEVSWMSATTPGYKGDAKADPFNSSKRKGYLSWDDYFMAIAFLSAQRSKDPNRQVGACIVSQDQVILGIGYNGFPRGCSDDELPWAKMSLDGDPLKTKYPFVCHAEVNAILNKNHASAAGQRLYVTMFPCNECAKVIIQAQIAEVVYFTDKGQGQSTNSGEASFVASRRLLDMAGVKVWQYKPLKRVLVLEYR